MKNEVRELRTAMGLSQQQLGEAMDVSRQTINSIEKERYTPSLPLAIEAERREYTVATAQAEPDRDGYRPPQWLSTKHGHLTITVRGCTSMMPAACSASSSSIVEGANTKSLQPSLSGMTAATTP